MQREDRWNRLFEGRTAEKICGGGALSPEKSEFLQLHGGFREGELR